MTKPKTVYLAGGISHNTFIEATQWRKLAADYLALHDIQTLDPMLGKYAEQWQDGEANFDHPGFSTEDIFDRDTVDIQNSDALLVNLETAKSIGTPWEMGYAYALGIRCLSSALSPYTLTLSSVSLLCVWVSRLKR